MNEQISLCVCKSKCGSTISARTTALLFTVGMRSIFLAYNRVQNNGEMLFLGKTLMMLQSEAPRYYFAGEKEMAKPIKAGVTKS